ncbi:hypothetical protein KM043_018315 [Ampulex compressa]|nr:hypothetical protein KM043_018315 [Ampulex compressa]
MKNRWGKIFIYITLLNAFYFAYTKADFLFPDHIKNDSDEYHQAWFESGDARNTESDDNTKFVGGHDDLHYRLSANRYIPFHHGHIYPGWPGRNVASHGETNTHAISHGTGSFDVNSHSRSEASVGSSNFPNSCCPYGPVSGSSRSDSTTSVENSWNPDGHFSGSSRSGSKANSQNAWNSHGHSASSAAASSSSASSGFLGGFSSSAAAAGASAGVASASAAASSSSSSSNGFRNSGSVFQGLTPLILRSDHEDSNNSEEEEKERLVFKD